MEGRTWISADSAGLKKKAHHGMLRPGTLPSKVVSQATSPTPAPGENKPVATRRGSTTVWWPVFHGIGRRAAICVPMARYRSAGRAAEEIGRHRNHARGSIPAPTAMTRHAYIRAGHERVRHVGTTLEVEARRLDL